MATSVTSSNMVLNWTEYRPVHPVDVVAGFFLIPAFSYTGIEWIGASSIQTQFNYSASKRFSLNSIPEKPNVVNYGLAIRYRIGIKVFRFKLWDDVGFILTAPLYNAEVIGKNFVIEVWSLDSVTAVTNLDPITVQTSIRQVVTNFSMVPTDFEDSVGAEVPASSISAPLPSPLPMVFGAGNAWLDNPECECGCQPHGESGGEESQIGGPKAILDAQGNAILDAGGNAILQP
jgi:hypothetical protein